MPAHPNCRACGRRAAPEPFELGVVGEQPLEDSGVVGGVVSVDEYAALAVAYSGRQTADVRRHDRRTARLRLDRDQPEGLVVRRDAHQRGSAVVVDEQRLLDWRHEADDVGDTEGSREVDEPVRRFEP